MRGAEIVFDAQPDTSRGVCLDEASLRYRDRIVGVGLDFDEHGHPPVRFADAFARAPPRATS